MCPNISSYYWINYLVICYIPTRTRTSIKNNSIRNHISHHKRSIRCSCSISWYCSVSIRCITRILPPRKSHFPRTKIPISRISNSNIISRTVKTSTIYYLTTYIKRTLICCIMVSCWICKTITIKFIIRN